MEPFTEFVDKNFKPGPLNVSGNDAKQTLLIKKDLDHLLASNDRKGIKAALRTNHWPADHEIRKHLWKKICQNLQKDRGNIYHDMLLEVFGEGDNLMVSLPQFVDPANMHSYHLSEKGSHIVKRIICILGNTNPDITYGPAIFPMCSLFLHYLEEEDCFNCMYTLLRHRTGYMVQTKIAFEATKHVLKELVKKYAKGPHSFISKQGLVIEGVLDNWIWWILNDLPFSYRVKIIDCFIFEGPKVLYRVALAILILFHKQSVKNNTRYVQGDITAAISDFCEEIPVTINKLLKVAFGIRGLSRKEIRKLTVQKEMYVKSIRNVSNTQLPHMSKSASCDSLHLKVSRSFSGPALDSVDSIARNGSKKRERSFSQGMAHFTNVTSTILSINQWHSIWNWLPTRISLYHPELLYTTSEDGTSLTTFFDRVEEREPILILVRTVKGEIFGAYCSTDWGERTRLKNPKSFFGTGESFLFTLNPKEQKFEWVGIKKGKDTPYTGNMFQASDGTMITIGGGSGNGLKLDENLCYGWSTRCDTFNNEPLVEGGEFECAVVEAFGFTDKS